MNIPDGAPTDLFITEALDQRPRPPTPAPTEARAIQELAGRMAREPEAVLPRFVDIALEITGAITGGLSLYETFPAPGVFRWHHLRGTLSHFTGATTPRNFSPCGITLDRVGPVLTLHPERVYSWLEDADVQLPEVLLVPLYLDGEEPLGTLWVVSESEGHFTRDHARALSEIAAFVGIAVRMVNDQAGLREDLAVQKALTQEMKHRVRNVFALTDGLTRMTAKSSPDKEALAEGLSERLHALSKAHALVTDSNKTDLASLLAEVLEPHRTHGRSRIHLTGPFMACDERATTGLALIFHELATNAAKHGALSQEDGEVDVTWEGDSGMLTVHWKETGGPAVTGPPKSNGLGSALVRNTVQRQFRGTQAYEWKPEGLSLSLTVHLSDVATALH